MYIQSIKIKNFRKIVEQKIELKGLNIFVGLNDVGKSSILKALNLFFNNETELGQKFNFEEDFSRNPKITNKKAKEITIELELKTPLTYEKSKNIIWKKVWRRDGMHEDKETITYVDGEEIPPKKKIKSWAKKIKYRYVPAVKGQDYFIELLGKLHDTLAIAIEEDLKKASNNFSETIKKSTEGITKEIEKKVNLESFLDLPPDLRNIFRSLEFKTGKENILLTHRGDGIKTRHIPVILKFIADQENLRKIKGTPIINTIWGYEEPENSLEMRAAFELAKNLYEYSEEIQLLITTHSPAFYSMETIEKIDNSFKIDKPINVKFVIESSSSGIDLIDKKDASMNIDDKIGILSLLEPKIFEILQESKIIKKEITKINSDKIILEGKDDKIIIQKSIQLFSPKLKKLLEENKLVIDYSNSGADGVANALIATAYTDRFKCFGIFDNDFEGQIKKEKVDKDERCIKKNGIRVKSKLLLLNQELGNIKQEFSTFDFELEDLFSRTVWEYAETQGYLEERVHRRAPQLSNDQTPKQFFETKFSDPFITKICLFKIKDSKKEQLVNWVNQNAKEEDLYSFKLLIKEIESFF